MIENGYAWEAASKDLPHNSMARPDLRATYMAQAREHQTNEHLAQEILPSVQAELVVLKNQLKLKTEELDNRRLLDTT